MGYWAHARAPTLDDETLARMPTDLPGWRVAYWEMQRTLGRAFVVPLLQKHGFLDDRARVLEVGPSEGGVLHALIEGSAREGHGLELSLERTEVAQQIARALDDRMAFFAGDITKRSALSTLTPPYDVVLFRDVIEHIPDTDAALDNAASLARPGAALLFTFPPYWSPFGAHQQIATRRALRVPWVQNSPLFPLVVDALEPDAEKREELHGLRTVALTLGRFERALARHRLRVVARELYLSRPIFNVRWGLPVVGAGVIGKLPFLRELLVTGAWYLATKER